MILYFHIAYQHYENLEKVGQLLIIFD